MKRKVLSALLTLCMIVTLLPAMSTAQAAAATSVWVGGVELGGSTKYATVRSNVVSTVGANEGNYNARFENGVLTLKDFVYSGAGYSDAAIFATGDLTIRLVGRNSVTHTVTSGSSDGISVTTDLTIKGSGSLTAVSDEGDAVNGISCVAFTVESGTVTAKGGTPTSGGKSYGIKCSSFSITGGAVIAEGGGNSAANDSSGIECSSGSITGGAVTATGGEAQTSIGISSDGGITVEGGTVAATGGTASSSSKGISASGGITVSGGTVFATGGETTGASASDSSYGIFSSNSGSSITVSGGTVIATGGTVNSGKSYGINGGTVSFSGGVTVARAGKARTSYNNDNNRYAVRGNTSVRFRESGDVDTTKIAGVVKNTGGTAAQFAKPPIVSGQTIKENESFDIATGVVIVPNGWTATTLTASGNTYTVENDTVIIKNTTGEALSVPNGSSLSVPANNTLVAVNLFEGSDNAHGISTNANDTDPMEFLGGGRVVAVGGLVSEDNKYSNGVNGYIKVNGTSLAAYGSRGALNNTLRELTDAVVTAGAHNKNFISIARTYPIGADGTPIPAPGGSWEDYTTAGWTYDTGNVNKYTINNEADLAAFAKKVNANPGGSDFSGMTVTLAADLDMRAHIWTPIGAATPFAGTFNGGGHTISGLYYNGTNQWAGLFGNIDGGTVKNVNVTNSYLHTTLNGIAYAGGIAGYANTSKIINCGSAAVVSSASTENDAHAGGVVGFNSSSSTVSNCYNSGNVSASASNTKDAHAGGVAGVNNANSTVTNCYNTGIVSASGGTTIIGGVVGENSNYSTVSNCYYKSYTASAAIGGGTSSATTFALPDDRMKAAVSEADALVYKLNAGATTISDARAWAVKGGSGSYPAFAHAITAAPATGGSVSFRTGSSTVVYAVSSDTVTIAVTPDAGYALSGVTVTKTSGTENVTVTNSSFTMPNYPVTVTASFSAVPSSGSGDSEPALVTKINSGESITASNLSRLISAEKDLTVAGKNGAKLIFDVDALKGIDEQTASSVTFKIEDVSASYSETHDGKSVFSLTVTSGGKAVSDFGGSVRVSLPYKLRDGESAKDVTVWYLAPDGTMTEVSCNYDEKTGLASFTATHFSEYAVGISEWVNPFTDVRESDWFYDAVKFVNRRGLFSGTGAAAFSPNEPMTREMLWTVLGRYDGQILEGADVYAEARTWAMAEGVTDGSDPSGKITREMLVTILWRYFGSPASGASLAKFSDAADISLYAKAAMSWAVEKGVIEGMGDGSISPKAGATRAQVATIMMRCCALA